MRSSSRRPWPSNRHSSTFSALAENSTKLVPRPSQLAPRRECVPAVRRMLTFWDEEDGGQWRDGKPELRRGAVVGMDFANIADIAAAIMRGVGVEYLAPLAAKGHAEAITLIDV